MNKFFEILLVGLVFSVLAVNESSWAAKNFKDDDWTHSFFERCSSRGGFANGSQVEWTREGDTKFLRFTLADGQKGNCSCDKIRRSGAPWWERSEITLGTGDRNITRLRTGGFYKIKLRVRFVQGFASDKESILQIYSKCQWKGGCSPLLQLRSIGNYPNPGYLRTEVLQKKPDKDEKKQKEKKKKGNWNSSATMEDYFQSRRYLTNYAPEWRNKTGNVICFTDDDGKLFAKPRKRGACRWRFSPLSHIGEWIDITLGVSVSPEEVTLLSQLESYAGIWTVPIQTINRPPSTLDPHIEIGLYRPGSVTVPNPTSTIDFDSISITTLSVRDFDSLKKIIYSRHGRLTDVNDTKYDRTVAGMKVRFKCLADYAAANDISDLPSEQEIVSLTTNLEGNYYYRSKGQIVKAGISKEAMDANKAALVRLVNFEGTNEEYCAKPVL